jgi:protein phosphatase
MSSEPVPAGPPPPSSIEDTQPLETSALPPMATSALVVAPDGRTFDIVRPLRAELHGQLYEAVTGPERQPVWLREALTESAAARLRHEAEVLRGLDLPAFPRLLACFEADGRTYLATDPAPGPTLTEAVAERRLTARQVVTVLAEAAAALSQLHARGWVHLSVRPSVVIAGEPVRLLDLSNAAPAGQRPPVPVYHPGYSPPELMTANGLDGRADVYAIGAILFHALSGQPMVDTRLELTATQPPLPLAGLPQILSRCLGERETRYGSMEELHRDLCRLARRLAPRPDHTLAAATTIGLEPTRLTNQDAYATLSGRLESDEGMQLWTVAAVADGMGGMAAGEVASDVAVKTVVSGAAACFAGCRPLAPAEQVRRTRQWVQRANDEVCAALATAAQRGGCTLLCTCVVGRTLTAAHVGDSRLYLLRGEEVVLLTRDHSLAMMFALQGQLAPDEVRRHPDRNRLTRSLGERVPLPEYFIDLLEPVTGHLTLDLEPGDVLLLCSDGLWEPVVEAEMGQIVRRHAPDLHAAANALLRLALERGGPDNATVVLLRIDVPAEPDPRCPQTDYSAENSTRSGW